MAGGAFGGAQEAAKFVAELTKELRNLSDQPLGQIGGELKDILTKSGQAVNEIKNVGKEADALVAKANKDFAQLNADLEKVGALAERINLPGMPGNLNEGLAPGDLTALQLGSRVNPAQGGTQMADLLAALDQRITTLMGPDNYIAKLLEVEIPNLRAGARSAQEAGAFLQNQLQSWMAGMQKELADPNTPPEMRKLLEELIHLAQTGNLYQGTLAQKLDQGNKAVLAAVQSSSGNIAAGVSASLERFGLLGGH